MCISQKVYLEPKWLRYQVGVDGFNKPTLEHSVKKKSELGRLADSSELILNPKSQTLKNFPPQTLICHSQVKFEIPKALICQIRKP